MRTVLHLNNDWKFTLGDCPGADYRGFCDEAWETVRVPHDWAVHCPFSEGNPSGAGYLPGGTGWYRTHFTLPENLDGNRITVNFDGVYNNCQVWCNSNNLGKHTYGYTSFCTDITQFVQPGDNVLCVCVRHEEIPDARWYTGSGIMREATIEITGSVCFSRHGVFVSTRKSDPEQAVLDISWTAQGGDSLTTTFVLYDGQGNPVSEARGSGGTGSCALKVSAPALWSPERPYLYRLEAVLLENGGEVDQISIPCGIRSFSFDADKGFSLNGIGRKLKGVCLHQDGGVLGGAVPRAVWRRRLQKLKRGGCNAVRMSHNPPESPLLELCDEMGFLVMDEAFDEWEGGKNKWWQGHNVYPPKRAGYSNDFPRCHEEDLTEMVRRDRNHPCVILWSIGNEIDYPNDPYGSPLFAAMTGNNDAGKPEQERVYDPNKPSAKRLGTLARELYGIVKAHDTTRPVTAAIAFPPLANSVGYTDALDIVGYNYKEELYEADHASYPGRVLYGSENGHRVKDWAPVRDRDYICGQFLWTGIDYLGEADGWPIRMSLPGLLTEAGFEKPKYFQRKALWTDELFARLATKAVDAEENQQNNEVFGWNYPAGERVEIICYSTAHHAELLLNGRSLGVREASMADEGAFRWEAAYEPGVLEVRVCRGDRTVTDLLETAGSPAELLLEAYAPEDIDPDGSKVFQVELALLDAAMNPVTLEERLVQWEVSGCDFLGTESGAADDVTPYTSSARATYRGKLIAYVRIKQTGGHAKVRAAAEGCTAAELELCW